MSETNEALDRVENLYNLASLEKEIYEALIGWPSSIEPEEIARILRKVADEVAPPPVPSWGDEPPF